MLGKFQKSELRIEIDAPASVIGDSLLLTSNLRQWLMPQQLSSGLPERLESGLTFASWSGPVAIAHHVQVASDNCLRSLLSQGIDGYHEWVWGDGWVQSRLEGISLLPLNLGQTFSLQRLRSFVLIKAQMSA
ncbi:MAG: hypothetical protein SAL07_03045 [Oscillatoria sp. PMC 1051.18]|nr:hypothetical protein [Oscillatoria sp. PMC 1050.18]MEC5028865.1 hypothetical protein [Oscillatoria sp. PMC 1051.18]